MSARTQFIGIKYETVLDLSLEHEYYAEGYCPHLRTVPSAACAQTLAAYRIQVRPTPKGVRLLAPVPAPVDLPETPLQLEFHVLQLSDEVLAVTLLGAGMPKTAGAYAFQQSEGIWDHPTGVPTSEPLPQGVRAVLRLEAVLSTANPLAVTLPLTTPMVEWRYYIVSDAAYDASGLQLAEAAGVVSTTGLATTPEAQTVQGRFPGRQVTALAVTRKLQRDFPAWYLVKDLPAGMQFISDVPPIPKPRPGSLPHLILDYSSILK